MKTKLLSLRLMSVASMVTEGTVVVDVGTDHGYVPIYLVENNICKKAYAADVNEGPLKKARENILSERLGDEITTVQSDGLSGLKNVAFDSVVIAGMGGLLITRLVNEAPDIENISEFILSPHRDIDSVRKTVLNKNFFIADEKIVSDAGKYYFIIKAINKGLYKEHRLKGNYTYDSDACLDEEYNEFDLLFGKRLFEKKDELFLEYLEKTAEKYADIVKKRNEIINSKDNRSENNGVLPEDILAMYKRAIKKFREGN